MKELIKKGFLLGLGAASLTRKRAEKVLKPLIRKGLVKANDANRLLNDMLKEANEYRKALERMGEAEIKKTLKDAGVKSIAEVKKLKQKAMALERLLRKKAKSAAIKAIKRL